MRLRSVGMLAVIALVLAACGSAAPEASAPSEGIHVHGDWTIDIYNEDGALDRSVEFSNALMDTGKAALAAALVGSSTPGTWSVRIQGSPDPCPDDAGDCITDELGTLVATFDARDPNFPIILSGEVSPTADSDLTAVWTLVDNCSPTVAPTDCTAANSPTSFTRKDLQTLDWNNDGTPNDGPIPVSAGQVVQIEVKITFASG